MFISHGLSYIMKETGMKEIYSRCELVSFQSFVRVFLLLPIYKDMCGYF